MKKKFHIRIYRIDEIRTVYRRFADNGWSVVYSTDGGTTWQSPPMDTGKWFQGDDEWVFAFLELKGQ